MNSKKLFEEETTWQKEWKDMPEFIQEKQKPFMQIVVRFACEEDLNEFSKAIGQKLTKKTKGIWFPQITRGIHSNKRYTDES